MARTDQGAQATEEHRLAQNALVAAFLIRFLAAWPLLDPTRLDETTGVWLDAVTRLIRTARQESADLAGDYYRRFREIDNPDIEPIEFEPVFTGNPPGEFRAPTRPVELPPKVEDVFDGLPPRMGKLVKPKIDWSEWDKAAETSMRVTGPAGQKRRSKVRVRFREAQDASLVEAVGAAQRQVRVGERQTLLRAVGADQVARGWIRVTDADPCSFCAMLASRGPVYKRGTFSRVDPRFTGPGTAKVHDHCGCSIEPVFSGDTEWPGQGKEFQRLWNRHIRGKYSGKDALRAWRRLYEQLQRDAAREAEVA